MTNYDASSAACRENRCRTQDAFPEWELPDVQPADTAGLGWAGP